MIDFDSSVYKCVREDHVSEINSDIRIFSHRQSSAKIMFVLNEDDNKVFNISFKTPPEDDSGVAHIMEHSVLCGSRKYPVKEPFVELMKSSLNTFLNAMTYPDKTIYPVASRNHKDFRNLVDVYMDAVFFPNLTRDAFEQEGWHYNVQDDGLEFKGVVYNEMKGVFSSPESYLDLYVNRALFPDSSYRYESGGYPENIPSLTYENYLQFHKEKYHPANSWIILYGDVDCNYWLDYLHKDYLSHFELPNFSLPKLLKQSPLTEPSEIHCSFPAPESEDKSSSMISISFVTGDILNLEDNFALGVLDAILIGSAGSPLKKALLESGLGGDTLDYGYGNETLQTTWSVGLRDAKAENKQAFVDLVFSELKKYKEQGLPEKMVAAALNICEFQLREANYGSYPKGLVYCTNVMNHWLYDGDPLAGLRYEELLANLKEKVARGGYFEALIDRVFLSNSHYVVAVCKPDPEMEKSLYDEERSRLDSHRQYLSPDDLQDLRKRNEFLLACQMEPDSEEALATIPHVSKSDIKSQIKEIPQEELYIGDVPVLLHELPTQGICYFQFSFNCQSVSFEEYPWLALMNSLLLKVGTSNLKYDDFIQEIAIQTGGMNSTVNIFSTKNEASGFCSHLWVQTKLMADKGSQFEEILKSVFTEIDFSDVKRIKELLGSMISRLKMNLQSNGDRTSRSYLGASLSKAGYLGNLITGPEFYEFLKGVLEDFEKDASSVIAKILSLKSKVINRSNLLINLTSSSQEYKKLEPCLKRAVDSLVEAGQGKSAIDFSLKSGNTGLAASGSVQYVAKGLNINEAGFDGHGSYDLVSQLLTTGYLWEKVRVQGGAYGCYLTFDRLSGALILASYRDPNLSETLNVFDEISSYLESLELSDVAFEKLIIGTFGRLDAPLTASQRGKLALNRYLTGVTTDEINKLRQQLLESTIEDIRNYSSYFKQLAEKGTVCIHANKQRLAENNELFDQIVTIGE